MILVPTKALEDSHEPLEGIHVAKKHRTTILYLVDKVHSEMFFPPSFFDIMVHLTMHLVDEIKYCGPVFLRNM